jgi:hypothetical protein
MIFTPVILCCGRRIGGNIHAGQINFVKQLKTPPGEGRRFDEGIEY